MKIDRKAKFHFADTKSGAVGGLEEDAVLELLTAANSRLISAALRISGSRFSDLRGGMARRMEFLPRVTPQKNCNPATLVSQVLQESVLNAL